MYPCFIIQSLGPGGAERVLTILANSWAEKDWPVRLLTFDNGEDPPFFPLHQAIDHHPLGLPVGKRGGLGGLLRNLKRVLFLRRMLKRISADAVISFIDRTNVVTLLAGLGLGLPVIVAERTDPAMLPSGKLWNILCRSIYPLAARVVVQSPEAADYYRLRLGKKPVVIPNPVARPEQMPMEDFRLSRPSLIAVGRFTVEKGFDCLLEAFARVAFRHPDWTLTIFGDGPLRSALEKQCKNLGLQERVKMPGLMVNVQAALEQADLFVLPSRFEGFPNALCEAMACGVASIATDCPSGPRQIIRHQVDGILVPNEDVDALALTMDRLMSDPVLRQRLGKRAVEVVDRFSVEKIVGMWEILLDQVVNVHRGPSGSRAF